ncbi:GW dipeptide domain-containing protein [Alkalihalobacillus trypoxylicola]
MGIINQEECFIYNTPNDLNVFKSAHPYKKSVYYIKRKITYNDEIFYLLSNQPSAKSDVIGWMKAKDVKTRQHTTIDEDNKTFIIIGTGKGFNRPWGSEKNYIYNTLNKYKNNEFHVIKTDRVGKTLWYYGLLDDKKVWIHENDLKD